MMDLIEKARELGVDNWTIADFVLGVESLRQQLAECERDAERYRWLRTQNPRQYQELWMYCLNSDVMFDDQVDECMNEAIAKVGAGKTGEGS